eukprot:c21973_g2_i1 orf=522-3224(-)
MQYDVSELTEKRTSYGNFCYACTMREAVLLLLLLLLLLTSVRVQAQTHAELSNEDILCIRQSREETALGRWLHCMHLPSSNRFQNPPTELPTVDEENLQTEQHTGEFLAEDTLPSDGIEDTSGGHHKSAPVRMHVDDVKEASSSHFQTLEMRAAKEEAQENLTVDKENPQTEQLLVNKGELLAEDELPSNGIQDKGNGHTDAAPVRMQFEDGKEAISSHFQTVEMRAAEEDFLLGWLKLNLGLLALGKVLFGLIKKCNRKKAGKKSSELSLVYSTKDGIEAAPEISKAVVVDAMPAKKHSETAHLLMLGSLLGSAVGAVFAEVLLKMCSLGSSVPTDKISLLLESALEDLSLLVQGDDECSRVVSDFMTSFKSTYATMYRIHQACTSYGGSREQNSHSQRENSPSIFEQTSEKQCTSTKSNDEIIHASRTDPLNDTCQVKKELPLQASSNNNKQVKLESKSLLAVGAFSEQRKCADHGEIDSGMLATSTVEKHDSALPIGFKSIEMSEACYERHEVPSYVDNSDDFEQVLLSTRVKCKDEGVTQLEYEVDDASSVCEELPGLMQVNALDELALMSQGYGTDGSKFQKDFLKFYERHVHAQERHNQIKFVELKQLMKQQILEEEKIQLTYAANGLMRENIALGRSKATFRENKVLEKQATTAYMSFSITCADELAAGLFVMLASLVYSVRRYSFELLNGLVSTCQPSAKEPRRSLGFHIDWFYNSLDSLAGKLQAFMCHIAVTGRILVGSILVGVVAWSLLRRSVTNSSQAMPATILIIVLGGICGFVGKVSVDSLGGCGNRWWVVWGAFCLLHALINCLTPSFYKLLHGSPTSCKARFGLPFWIRRLAFHFTLVLGLPVLAGLLPFGSLYLVMNDLFLTLVEVSAGVFSSFTEWSSAQLA